ncbi:hypothetical protein PoB_007190200 [Plakobranchus ocellatus]|uniref:Uncharacterized protein n=1 Tax=Plakobranchus ocellatus TaxID=259542 RepID=A0AAV4DMQ9_9GAST|nr:hypothetical protein PoB_007190200 [Plakobranchus ocellatus]
MILHGHCAKASRPRNMFSVLQSSSKPGQVHVGHNNCNCNMWCKGLPVQPKAKTLVFTSEGGAKSWCGSAASMDSQRKSLLDGCNDWEFSAVSPKGTNILKSSKTHQ